MNVPFRRMGVFLWIYEAAYQRTVKIDKQNMSIKNIYKEKWAQNSKKSSVRHLFFYLYFWASTPLSHFVQFTEKTKKYIISSRLSVCALQNSYYRSAILNHSLTIWSNFKRPSIDHCARLFLFWYARERGNHCFFDRAHGREFLSSIAAAVACEYSRLSSLPAPEGRFARETSVIYSRRLSRETPFGGRER